MPHPVFQPGAVAVVTGGASGIGLAAVQAFARLGLAVVIADVSDDHLAAAEAAVLAECPNAPIVTRVVDVSRREDLEALEAEVRQKFGGTDVLMNNAGVQPGSHMFAPQANWERILGVNLWGVIHGCHVFVPHMIARGRPGLVINTGSKQGITTPPGDPAYNVSKAGVKTFTELLAHELRTTENCAVTAHLLIPGFVFTALTARGRTEKPAGAWTPEQTIASMMTHLDRGDFYILCPDNEVTRTLDERRILWAAGDLVENRPALSRWHPDFAEAFSAFVKSGEKD